jgi:hypothetical protein
MISISGRSYEIFHTLCGTSHTETSTNISEQRTEVAEQFKHSPGTAQQYVRSFAEKREATIEQMISIALIKTPFSL